MKLNQAMTVAGLAVALTMSASNLQAQDNPPAKKDGQGQGRGRGGPGGGGGGGFDPAQMEKWMMDRTRERLDIKDDTEWKAIEPLVKKVGDIRREQVGGGLRGMMRGGAPGGDNNGGGGGRTRGGFGGEASAEETALQKAITDKAPKAELKSKMAAFRKVKEANEAKLKQAQDALKKVLTVEQEAAALQMGLVQ